MKSDNHTLSSFLPLIHSTCKFPFQKHLSCTDWVIEVYMTWKAELCPRMVGHIFFSLSRFPFLSTHLIHSRTHCRIYAKCTQCPMASCTAQTKIDCSHEHDVCMRWAHSRSTFISTEQCATHRTGPAVVKQHRSWSELMQISCCRQFQFTYNSLLLYNYYCIRVRVPFSSVSGRVFGAYSHRTSWW